MYHPSPIFTPRKLWFLVLWRSLCLERENFTHCNPAWQPPLLPRPTHPALSAHTQLPPSSSSSSSSSSSNSASSMYLSSSQGCRLQVKPGVNTNWVGAECFPIKSRSKATHGCGRVGSTQSGVARESNRPVLYYLCIFAFFLFRVLCFVWLG